MRGAARCHRCCPGWRMPGFRSGPADGAGSERAFPWCRWRRNRLPRPDQGCAGPRAGGGAVGAGHKTRLGSPQAFGGAARQAGLGPAQLAQVHAGVGLAGTGRSGALAALAALPHPFARIAFVSDGTMVCLGAHSGMDGAIVISGTVSIGLGLVEGRDPRVGGYGFPISDAGSGADLGLQAVQMALRSHDGRLERTALLSGVIPPGAIRLARRQCPA